AVRPNRLLGCAALHTLPPVAHAPGSPISNRSDSESNVNSHQLAQTYLFLLLQLAAVLLLLNAAWRLAAWLWPEAYWGERLAAAGVVSGALVVVLVIAPGLLGLLHPQIVGAEVLALWAIV